MLWSVVKGYIGHRNMFGVREVVPLIHEALAHVTPELWVKCINHCINKEDTDRAAILGPAPATLLVDLNYDSDEDDTDEEEEA
jgi:hypothetical protein